jgi:hypothetical protein
MTRLTILTAAALLCGVALASAQTSSGIATAPADTRKVDEAQVPGTKAGSPTNGPTRIQDNWRSSSGLNNDPDNPSGAPGSGSGLGTSPTR